MVDIHYHLIFGVDDGPKSIEASLELAEASAAEGVTHIVATPHASARYPYNFEVNRERLAILSDQLAGRLTLGLGCDFHLSYENLQEAFANPSPYVIGNTHYLLVEFSNYSVPQNTTDSFLKLGDRGITPVITHPERNPILRESLERVVDWAEQGCVIQMTGSALTGFWGDRTRHTAEWLLERQCVHVLATDTHDLEKRVPILSTARDAAAEIVGEEIADALVTDNPRAIVNDQPLPFFPRPSAVSGYRKR